MVSEFPQHKYWETNNRQADEDAANIVLLHKSRRLYFVSNFMMTINFGYVRVLCHFKVVHFLCQARH